MPNWLSLTATEIQALQLSMSIALRSVVFNLPIGIGIAWLLTRRRFPGRLFFDAIVHLPLVLPPVVIGYVLLMLLGIRSPIGAWLFDHFNIRLVFTSTGAAVATAVMSLPLMVRSIRIALEGVDRGLEQAARTLGASAMNCFCTVTLPLMLPGVLAGIVTAFSAGLGEFGAVITFVGNVPGETQTLPLALYSALQSPSGSSTAAHLATLSCLLGLTGLVLAEVLARSLRRHFGHTV